MNWKGCPATLSAMLIVAWTSLLKEVTAASNKEVEQHLEMGNKMLAAGQLADALSHYHAAVEGDPKNYVPYYRRATVYLAMGKSKSALPDLDKVIELKPDFTAAKVQRGNVKLKQGKLQEAERDFQEALTRDPNNKEADEKLEKIPVLRESLKSAQSSLNYGDYQGAIDLLTPAIETCPWDPDLRELRAECYIAQGDYFKAIGDIRPTTKLRSDNTAGYYKLSTLYYEMGEAQDSLTEIRECLKLDPDHKECHPHYKKVKKLVKQMESVSNLIGESKWDECVEKADAMLKTEPKLFVYRHRAHGHKCHCHSKAGRVKEALEICTSIIEKDANNVDAFCDRAEAHIINEDFEAAVNDYKAASQINADLRKVQEGLKRAEKLVKQSKKRDYYKILGVKRSASKREITKAYRKLAAEWHPDRFSDGPEKEEAQKKFIDIAAAKEVLTDAEKRQKFDNGEDPLDPEEQAQGGGPFWHQGFNPFGGGGFQFKFHF